MRQAAGRDVARAVVRAIGRVVDVEASHGGDDLVKNLGAGGTRDHFEEIRSDLLLSKRLDKRVI